MQFINICLFNTRSYVASRSDVEDDGSQLIGVDVKLEDRGVGSPSQ